MKLRPPNEFLRQNHNSVVAVAVVADVDIVQDKWAIEPDL